MVMQNVARITIFSFLNSGRACNTVASNRSRVANVTWLTLGHFTLSGFVDQVILTHLFLFLLRLYSSRPDTLHIITLHVDVFPPRSINRTLIKERHYSHNSC